MPEHRDTLTTFRRSRRQHINRGTTRRQTTGVELGIVLVLSPEERARVVETLLAYPPCKVPRGPRGPTSREQAAYKRRSLVDLALIQATLGLRINEALALPADKLTKTAGGIAHRRGHAGGFQDQQRPRRAALRRASWGGGLRAHPSPRRCGAYESR